MFFYIVEKMWQLRRMMDRSRALITAAGEELRLDACGFKLAGGLFFFFFYCFIFTAFFTFTGFESESLLCSAEREAADRVHNEFIKRAGNISAALP